MNNIDVNYISKNIKTHTIGKKIRFLSSVDSTNQECKRIINCGEAHGMVVIADTQTNGRGRHNREWISPSGVGVWMSIILKSSLNSEDLIKLSTLTCLSVRKAIETVTELNTYIKWPNDIVINKKKVSGILIESTTIKQKTKFVIIGIGVNVNQSRSNFKTLDNASSLAVEKQSYVKREETICKIIDCFEEYYKEFLITRRIDIDELKKASVLLHKRVVITYANKEIIANVEDFMEDGSMIVRDDLDNVFSISSASVRGLNSYID